MAASRATAGFCGLSPAMFTMGARAVQVRLRPWAIRPVGPGELDGMAVAAGLERERRDGGWRGETFDDASDRHVTIYRRRAIPSPSVIAP